MRARDMNVNWVVHDDLGVTTNDYEPEPVEEWALATAASIHNRRVNKTRGNANRASDDEKEEEEEEEEEEESSGARMSVEDMQVPSLEHLTGSTSTSTSTSTSVSISMSMMPGTASLPRASRASVATEWTASLDAAVESLSLAHLFDFEQVATHLRQMAATQNSGVKSVAWITADSVRVRYAVLADGEWDNDDVDNVGTAEEREEEEEEEEEESNKGVEAGRSNKLDVRHDRSSNKSSISGVNRCAAASSASAVSGSASSRNKPPTFLDEETLESLLDVD